MHFSISLSVGSSSSRSVKIIKKLSENYQKSIIKSSKNYDKKIIIKLNQVSESIPSCDGRRCDLQDKSVGLGSRKCEIVIRKKIIKKIIKKNYLYTTPS